MIAARQAAAPGAKTLARQDAKRKGGAMIGAVIVHKFRPLSSAKLPGRQLSG